MARPTDVQPNPSFGGVRFDLLSFDMLIGDESFCVLPISINDDPHKWTSKGSTASTVSLLF